MKFTELNLSNFIMQGLTAQGFSTATEIQALALPELKKGNDVIGLSHTGSGKTYAFGIPALECIDAELSAVQVLIVCPTRELAMQETDDLRKLTNFTASIKTVPIYGGSNMDRQIQALKKDAKVVIGTPGRLMDHLRRKTLKLNNLKMVILDEADEMLNMGFKEDIETILQSAPTNRQTVMFSATMPAEIMKLTKQFMKAPVLIKSKTQDSPQAFIKQHYIHCDKTKKTEILINLYATLNPTISIIFCNTKRMTEQLAGALNKSNVAAVCLHGDMRQSERKRVMEGFKKNGKGILIATDVAARGIDIKNVDLVVNYDLPNNDDYYIHRIGRTARAGKKGTAVTLLNTKQQVKDLQNLIKKTGNTIEVFGELSTAQPVVSQQSAEEKEDFTKPAKFKNNFSREKNNRLRDKKSAYREKANGRSPKRSYSENKNEPRFSHREKPSKQKDSEFLYNENLNEQKDQKPDFRKRTAGSKDQKFSFREKTNGQRSQKRSYRENNDQNKTNNPSSSFKPRNNNRSRFGRTEAEGSFKKRKFNYESMKEENTAGSFAKKSPAKKSFAKKSEKPFQQRSKNSKSFSTNKSFKKTRTVKK